MNEPSPIAAVDDLAWTATPLPRCAEHGDSGHLCLPCSDDADLSGLLEAIAAWYGRPLTLDINDPHPLLAPFADRTTPPARTLPEDLSWVERIRAITGWAEGRHRPPPHAVDWIAVEDRLATTLPDDYKQIAEVFGCGAFDGYLQLHVPDAQLISYDFVRGAEHLAEFAVDHSTICDPYSVYPAPGGLLLWAGTQQADRVYWLTEGPNPNHWPILTTDDARDEWQRFDGTTGEFIFRMLTEPLLPFLRAETQDVPWFTRYGPG